MFRLFIDIPLENLSKEESIQLSKALMEAMNETVKNFTQTNENKIQEMNYRLGNDDDRQKSNYLDINENGHCSKHKSRMTYK